MNFDDFARQMTLKYQVALAIAVLKNKPDNILLDQYINRLRSKIDKSVMEYDSDITICSDDFQFDYNANNENNDEYLVVNDVQDKNETLETNFSANILDDFDLDQFIQEKEGKDGEMGLVSQDLYLTKGLEAETPEKVNRDPSNLHTQSTFCENAQSQNLLDKPFELIQSNLTFRRRDTQTDETECFYPNDILRKKQSDFKNDHFNTNSHTIGLNSVQNTSDIYDSQQTHFPGFTDNHTHVSQSQSELMRIQHNHLFNIQTKGNESKVEAKSQEKQPINTVRDHNSSIHVIESFYNGIKDDKEIISSESSRKVISNEDFLNKNLNKNMVDDCRKIVVNEYDNTLKPATIENVEITNDVQAMDGIDNDKVEDVQSSRSQLISFKVIEELNRVKTYLNKKERASSTDRYATDSGYKSDSQSRGSFKGSLHPPDTWVNQSAHSLLSFVTNCPMVSATREIANEISWVLGRLIDRLHDEERYPSFLEEVLETVETLLKEVHGGGSYVEDVGASRVWDLLKKNANLTPVGDPSSWRYETQFAETHLAELSHPYGKVEILRKDENIHRLFLLNRSYHIIKYTIEKITNILEKFHSQINDDTLLEIVNTVEMENLCYILHILETLIKRHSVTKELLSQSSTQTSQDDEKFLRKSSITDIWRKKWNPNYKADIIQVAAEKKCVEVKCSEILNKIIVQAMDGYSLISFAALQCFNLLQN